MTDYYLLAVSGDCSATGMTDKAEVLPVPAKDLDAVSAYLRNQLEIDLTSATITFFEEVNLAGAALPSIKDAEGDIDWGVFSKLMKEHERLGNTLIEQGVFKNKWHKRTNWALTPSEAIPA